MHSTEKENQTKFFQGTIEINALFEKLQIEAQKIGARVHVIQDLVVDYTRSHKKAALAGGPQTGSDFNVLKIADKYNENRYVKVMIPESKKVTKTFVLLNWTKGGGSYLKAINWACGNGMVSPTTPHVAFAVGEYFPKLNYQLGPNPMRVIETTGAFLDGNELSCSCVCWNNKERTSNIISTEHLGSANDWFVFDPSLLISLITSGS